MCIKNSVCPKGRPKEAVESIYISIENNSICAKGRPQRGCKKHIYDT